MKLIKMTAIFALFVCSTQAFAFGQKRYGSDPTVVQSVDLNRYAGLWHQVAHSPNFFQRNCIRSTAQYEVLSESQISVFNTCYKASGRVTTISGAASILNADAPSKLRVVFNTLFKPKGDYWIVALDDQYQWAVVSGPGMGYNFVLSRTFPLAKETLDSIIKSLKDRGFPTDTFIYDRE